MAVKKDLVLEKHAAFKEYVQLSDGGKPVDLYGWSATLQVRGFVEAPTAILSLSSENGHIALDDQGGLSITLAAEATGVLPAGVFVYDLVVHTTRDAIRVCEGRFRIEEGVTRWVSE